MFAPEGTPQVLSYAFERPGRYSYVSSMMRGERAQRGRLREFTQLGVEEVSTRQLSNLQAIESIRLMQEVLQGYEVTTRLGYLGCKDDQEALREALREAVPGCSDCERRRGTNPVRMLDCQTCEKTTWPTFETVGCGACKDERDTILLVLQGRVTYDPYLVRGLDYYRGPVWEADAGGLTVGGGGAYSAEVRRGNSVREVNGIGWALGLERLLLQTGPPERREGPDVLAALVRNAAEVKRVEAIGEATGRVVLYGSLKDVLRRADLLGARSALLVGGRELSSGTGTLKDLATGEQESLPLPR